LNNNQLYKLTEFLSVMLHRVRPIRGWK